MFYFMIYFHKRKHKNHTIDNIAKISENSNDFLRFLVKSVKIKFYIP